MTIPVLSIVQARLGSTRLPRKMLLDLGGHPLIWWAWNAARTAFGDEHTVVAMPASEENDGLAKAVEGFGGRVFRWPGDERDVLGRFHACAHTYRWHPDSVIVRVTPDDPLKQPVSMLRVAAGERLPVELGGEAFTLAMLDTAEAFTPKTVGWSGVAFHNQAREHLTHNRYLCTGSPPPAPEGCWTVDTADDLDRMRALFANAYADVDIASVAGAHA